MWTQDIDTRSVTRMTVETISAAETHIGRRSSNQDYFHVDAKRRLFVIADGMGGYGGGEVASCLAVETFARLAAATFEDPDRTWQERPAKGHGQAENITRLGYELANQEVRQRQRGELRKMGSTLASLLIDGAGRAVIGHVGDSRVYRMRRGELTQLTRDHSAYEELLAAGVTDLPAKRDFPLGNVVTRAIGHMELPCPEIQVRSARPGDVFLLCTDGLSNVVEPERIAQVLGENEPNDACRLLVSEAFECGSRDNITAVAVKIGPARARKAA